MQGLGVLFHAVDWWISGLALSRVHSLHSDHLTVAAAIPSWERYE